MALTMYIPVVQLSNSEIMMSAQLKYSCSCLVLYNNPWTWTSSLCAICHAEKRASGHESTCGTTPKAFLHVCNETELQEMPSMEISPSVEARRSRAESRVLFPEPVRPSRPICARAHIYKHTQSIKKAWLHHFLQILHLASLCACMHQSLPAETILYILPGHILKALGPFFCGLAATISPFIRRPWTS